MKLASKSGTKMVPKFNIKKITGKFDHYQTGTILEITKNYIKKEYSLYSWYHKIFQVWLLRSEFNQKVIKRIPKNHSIDSDIKELHGISWKFHEYSCTKNRVHPTKVM